MRNWLRDRGLGVLFVSIFLVTWAGQLVFEWLDYANDERAHGADPKFWSEGFWASFWQSTLENWQSEFLQLLWQAAGLTFLLYWGSSQSRESDERIEVKIDRLLEERGIDPAEVSGRVNSVM